MNEVLAITAAVAAGATPAWPVLAGAAAASAAALGLAKVTRLYRLFDPAFPARADRAARLIERFVRYAELAGREGLLAVAGLPETKRDPLLRRGLHLLVRETDAILMKAALDTDAESPERRGVRLRAGLMNACRTAPVMAALAAAAALAVMVAHRSTPWTIGSVPGLGVLLGVCGLFVTISVCAPLAQRVGAWAAADRLAAAITTEGLLGLRAGDDAAAMAARLRRLVPPAGARKDAPAAAPSAKAA